MINVSTVIFSAITFFVIGFILSFAIIAVCVFRSRPKNKGRETMRISKPEINTDFEQPQPSVDGHSALSEFNKLPPIK